MYYIGNKNTTFRYKIIKTLKAINEVLGLPAQRIVFKKLLVDPSMYQHLIAEAGDSEDSKIDFHKKILAKSMGDTDKKDFEYVSITSTHTYLKAPKGQLIGIRSRHKEEEDGDAHTRGVEHYTYERRYFMNNQRIHQKRILSARAYDDLWNTHRDASLKELKLLITSFQYDQQYFQLETITNIKGNPTYLICRRIEEG